MFTSSGKLHIHGTIGYIVGGRTVGYLDKQQQVESHLGYRSYGPSDIFEFVLTI